MVQRKFLLIDDDAEDRRWLMDTIEQIVPLPHFIEAGDAKEGLRRLHDGLVPDIVFLDLNMPVMSGMDFLSARLTNKTVQSIPVVVMSTNTNPSIINQVVKMGANRYVVKPTTDGDMIKEIRAALEAFDFAISK